MAVADLQEGDLSREKAKQVSAVVDGDQGIGRRVDDMDRSDKRWQIQKESPGGGQQNHRQAVELHGHGDRSASAGSDNDIWSIGLEGVLGNSDRLGEILSGESGIQNLVSAGGEERWFDSAGLGVETM